MHVFLEVKIEVFLKGKAYRKQAWKLEAHQRNVFHDTSHKRKGIKEREENFQLNNSKAKVPERKYRTL